MDMKFIGRVLNNCTSVLDVGCGPNSPMRLIEGKVLTGLDAHAPSIEASRAKGIHRHYFVGTAQELLATYGENSFDAVVMLDLIEHLEKSAGRELLRMSESIAARKVLVFTPSGFLPQPPAPDNPWQEHKSGWTAAEFRDLGYEVSGANGWRHLRKQHAACRRPARLTYPLSRWSQRFVASRPEHAFALFAVKSII